MVFVICATFCKTLASKAGEQLPKCQNPEDQDNWLSYGSNLQSVNSATEEHGMESSSLENQNRQQILDNCLTKIGWSCPRLEFSTRSTISSLPK